MKNSGKPDGNHPAIKVGKSSKSTSSNSGNPTDITPDVSGSVGNKSKWKGDLTAKWAGLPGAGNKDLDISTDVG